MGKKMGPEYIKRLNRAESIQINNLLKNKEYANALSLASDGIRRNKNNHNELGRFKELKLRALLGLGKYDKVIESAFEYAYNFKERQFNFLMLELRAKIGKGNSQEVLDELPNLFPLYPNEYINLINIKIEALFKEKRYLEIINETELMSQRYPRLSSRYDIIKIDALIYSGKYKEAFDEITTCTEKYPTLAKNFLDRKIEIYIKAEEYDLAIVEIEKLRKEYPKDSVEYDKKKEKVIKRKRKLENNEDQVNKKVYISLLKYLLELDDEIFMSMLKEIEMKEAVFLLSARYKLQGSSTLALGCLNEYEKRAKENTDDKFVEYMRKKIKLKPKIFDMREWTKSANKLELNLSTLEKYYDSRERSI